jgi:hypothetical protein
MRERWRCCHARRLARETKHKSDGLTSHKWSVSDNRLIITFSICYSKYYHDLISNTNRLSFLYIKNCSELSSKEYYWLRSQSSHRYDIWARDCKCNIFFKHTSLFPVINRSSQHRESTHFNQQFPSFAPPTPGAYVKPINLRMDDLPLDPRKVHWNTP